MKICSKCGIRKKLSSKNFYRFAQRKDGYRPACKNCEEKEAVFYRKKSHVKVRMFKYHKKWKRKNWFRLTRYTNNYHRKLRLQTLIAYGNKCVCCNDKHEEFLTLDHKYGDGAIHRKIVGVSSVSRHLRQLGFPKGKVRILCFNCHLSITHRGYCPHEREKL